MKTNRSETIPGIGKAVKPDANLPAVRSETFDLTAGETLKLDPALLNVIDKTDYEGYETPRESLPICSIRQKPLVSEGGRTLEDAGGFKMYDAVSKGTDSHIADISGEKGLLVTIMLDQQARTYWANMTDGKPACKSLDGLVGVGDPGGACATCELSQFHNEERPKCSAEINCLVWDHNLGASYVLRLGRSAIRAYNLFKTMVKRSGNGHAIPLHALMVRVLTNYETEPAPHWTPRFVIEGQTPVDLFLKLKDMRGELRPVMQATAKIDTQDDEHPSGVAGKNAELPADVRPDGDTNSGDLPF